MSGLAQFPPWRALAALICLLLFLPGCETGAKKEVHLIIKTPMEELNTVASPDIRSVPQFLEQAARDFALNYEKARVIPEVRAFNYVDELKAVPATFDTPEAPDLLFGAFFNLSGYIHTGRVAPLDSIITPEMRADIDDTNWKVASRKGKTYLMPFVTRQNILIYNKKLFRECGLERFCGEGREIQNWTLPEWETILDTLAKKLPKGVYPLAIFAKNNQGDTHILSYLRAFGGKIFTPDGDFDFQNPKVVKALAWLREGVIRGWFPPHPENLEMKDCSELFANGQLAIYMFNNANRSLYSDLENYGFVNYPGNIATQFYNGFAAFDNKDPDRLKAAMDFLSYLHDTDKWRDISAGNIPASKRTMERYGDRITMLKEFRENARNVVDFMQGSPNWQGQPDSFRSVFWPIIHKLLALDITPEQCAAELDKACNAALAIGRKDMAIHD